MAVSKVSDLNSLFNNIYEISQFVLEEEAAMPQLVTIRSLETMAPRIISQYGQHTAGTVAEAGTVSATTLSKTAQGTISPYRVHHKIELTREDMMTDPDGAANSAGETIGRAIARKVDNDLTGQFSSLTAGKGTAGSALTLGNIASAMTKLRAEKVIATNIYGVLHPYQWHDLLGQFTDVNSTPVAASEGEIFNEALRNYSVGRYLGAQWFTDGNIGTGTAVYGAMFSQEALMLDIRQPYTLEMDEELDTLSMEFHGYMLYGVGINRDEAGVYLLSDASEPA